MPKWLNISRFVVLHSRACALCLRYPVDNRASLWLTGCRKFPQEHEFKVLLSFWKHPSLQIKISSFSRALLSRPFIPWKKLNSRGPWALGEVLFLKVNTRFNYLEVIYVSLIIHPLANIIWGKLGDLLEKNMWINYVNKGEGALHSNRSSHLFLYGGFLVLFFNLNFQEITTII